MHSLGRERNNKKNYQIMKWRFLRLDWKYASGELVIVTAGVLIALAATSWVESQREKELERSYIQRLIQDIETDIASVISLRNLSELRAEYAQIVIDSFESESIEISPKRFAEAIEFGSYFSYPSYVTTTIDDLMSTGNLRLIRNENIKEIVANYYAEIEWTSQFRDLIIPVQASVGLIKAEVLDLSDRLALFHIGNSLQCGAPGYPCRGEIPWGSKELTILETDAEIVLDRLLANPEAKTLYSQMARSHGQHYFNLTSIEQHGNDAIAALRDYLDEI